VFPTQKKFWFSQKSTENLTVTVLVLGLHSSGALPFDLGHETTERLLSDAVLRRLILIMK